MILFAAVVPPPSAVEIALADVHRALQTPPAPPRRWWQRRPPTVDPADVRVPLDVLPADKVVLTVARFGNLTNPDAHRLTDALLAAAVEWARPTVRVGGASLWETSRIDQLGLDLSGDVDTLAQIARDVRSTAQALGLFLDRRDFRPSMAIAPLPVAGEVDARPTVEAVAQAMSGYAGEPWTVDHLSLLRQATDTSPLIEHAHVPLSTRSAADAR